MLNEFTYCPRLNFYEWVDGVFAHSDDTVEGALRHETLGEKAEELLPADASGDERLIPQEFSSGPFPPTIVGDLIEATSHRHRSARTPISAAT